MLVLFEELVDDIISKCFLQKSELYVHKAATMIVYIVWSWMNSRLMWTFKLGIAWRQENFLHVMKVSELLHFIVAYSYCESLALQFFQ